MVKTVHLRNWSFEYRPMKEYKKVMVTFLKQECNTAVILYNGEKKRINQRYVYASLGLVEPNQQIEVKEDFIYNY